jgi:CYTH domain-containing protein
MAGTYARAEIERRFRLATVPDQLINPRAINDRYLHGTRLRLRVVSESDGTVTRKLGHKVPMLGSVSAVMHTSLYLDENELNLLSALPADSLVKTRHWVADAPGWAIDVFDGVLRGLVTAEIECARVGEAVSCPWAGVDVTEDIRYTGAQLAQLNPWQAAALLG